MSAASVTATAAPAAARAAAQAASAARTRGCTIALSRARRRGVREHDRAEGRPVEDAVRADDPPAEDLGDRGERGLARRHDVARDLIEVQGREAVRGEPAQDVRLAARDAAGQPDAEHAAPRLRRLAPRARCWP